MSRPVSIVAILALIAAEALRAAPPEQGTAPGASPSSQPHSAAWAPAPVVSIDQQSLLARLERADPELVLLDVRTAEEFSAGHLPRARNIAHDVLGQRLDDLADARDGEIVVYCRSGRRSRMALEVLRAAGFRRLAHLDGDWLAWEAAGRPIERVPAGPAPTAAPAAPAAPAQDSPTPRP